MTTAELNEKIKNLRELNRMAEELSAEIESIKDEIKSEMTAQNTDVLTGTDFKITWKDVKSSRFDTTAFKKQYFELYELFTKETTSKRFILS